MTRNVKTTRLEVSRAYFRGGQIGGQQIDRVKKPIALTPGGWHNSCYSLNDCDSGEHGE